MTFGRLGALGRGFGRMGSGGKAAREPLGRILANTGSFILTGNDAGLIYARTAMGAGVGSFTLTGQDATLTKSGVAATMPAETGVFTLTGDAMTPLVDYRVPSDLGTFTLTGQDASTKRGFLAGAAAGTFTLTGQAATLTYTPASSFALTYGGSGAHSSPTGSTYPYGTLSYPSGATRLVVLVSGVFGATASITGVTVGGNALTHVGSTLASRGTSNSFSDIWISSAPIAGSSGAVEVTYGSTLGWGSAVAVYGLTTSTPTASFGSTVVPGSGVSPQGMSVTVPSGGGGLVIAMINDKTLVSLSNATVDADVNSQGNHHIFAHTTSTGTFNSDTAWSGGNTDIVMSAAAWNP